MVFPKEFSNEIFEKPIKWDRAISITTNQGFISASKRIPKSIMVINSTCMILTLYTLSEYTQQILTFKFFIDVHSIYSTRILL